MSGTQNQPVEYEQISYNSPTGSQWGKSSSELLGMYGSTPVGQYVGVGAASTYLTTSNTTSTCGFADMASLTSMILQVSTVTAALRAIGLIN